MSVLDSLSKLNDMLATTDKTPTTERPTMEVPPAALVAFARLVPAQRIMKIAEKRAEVEEAIVSDEMMTIYADIMFSKGCRPVNPRLKVDKDNRPDMSGLFQVQEKIKLVYEKGDAPAQKRLMDALEKAGFTMDRAAEIVQKEVNYLPMTVLRPLNELAMGNALEKSAAAKVIAMMTGEGAQPFTSDERKVAIKKIEILDVKDGFLERAPSYCKTFLELKMLFKVMQPVHFVSHSKYGESDTPEERNRRLAEEAHNLIMTKEEK